MLNNKGPIRKCCLSNTAKKWLVSNALYEKNIFFFLFLFTNIECALHNALSLLDIHVRSTVQRPGAYMLPIIMTFQ
jgi:hypothetical protein